MKKILSVLLAVLMMTAVSAQGFRRTANRVAPAKDALTAALMTRSTHPKAAKSTKSTQDVTITSYYCQYYMADNDWYYTLYDENDGYYHFDIVADEIESGHTYTLDEMLADYTNCSPDGYRLDAVAASFTLTRNADGTETIEAQMTDEEGTVYNLHYVTPGFENAIDTTEIVCDDVEFTDWTSDDGSFEFYGETSDGTYRVDLNYISSTVAGEFTLGDCILDYTKVGIYNAESDSYDVPTTVNVHLMVTENDGAYEVDAWLLDDELHCYHVTMTYTLPVATDTIDVVVPAAMLQTEAGWFSNYYTWTGMDVDNFYRVEIAYAGTDVTGEFSFNDLESYSNIDNGDVETDFVFGNFSVEAAGDGYALEAYLIGEDMHCYHINMTYARPDMEDATDTIELTISDPEFLDLTALEEQAFQFYGTTDDEAYTVSVVVNATQVAGEYGYADFLADYTNIVDEEEMGQIEVVNGHATVTETADGYQMDAYLLGSNLHCYHTVMTYVIPVATDTVEFQISEPIMNDHMEDAGWFQLRGWSTDGHYYATFSNSDFRTEIAGEYSFFDFDEGYCYINIAEAGDTTRVYTLDGHVTVTATATGYLLEAWYLGEDLHCYHFTMTYSETGINTANKVEVKVYPNPATDVLHIEADGITRVDVLDIAGRVVMSRTQLENTVNVSGLANGIYMLRTTTKEGVNVQRIVKK